MTKASLMHLGDIVRQCDVTGVDGPLDRTIVGMAYDSRRVVPGTLFVAVPGSRLDGHDFIANAVERGASAVICERNGFVPPRATRIRVRCAREALARASAAFYEHPSTKLKVIGVTGTHGKTTVAFMIKRMLEEAGIPTGLISTIHYEVGDRIIPAHRSTPEALEVQHMMAAMLRAGCQACVIEVSSHALAQHRVAGVAFDVAVFTNLGPDHLDYHEDMESYFDAKRKLFAALSEGTKRSGSVINIDDPFGARLASETVAELQLTYSLGRESKLRATGIQLGAAGIRMTIEGPGATFGCRLPMIGRHNVYNALAASGAALVAGVPVPAIQSALSSMPPVPGRLESVSQGQPFRVYVDYAHTEDALRQVLTSLREITPGRLLLVFGCGGSRDTGKRARMGGVAAELADHTLITNDNPRREDPAQIADEILKGYQSIRSDAVGLELDRTRAIDTIIRLADQNDTVLIAGKGHETYQELDDTVIPFDDRIYVRESLQGLGFARRNARSSW